MKSRTQRQRDRELIAEAGPWRAPFRASGATAITVEGMGMTPGKLLVEDAVQHAVCRVLNRIAREVRAATKGKR